MTKLIIIIVEIHRHLQSADSYSLMKLLPVIWQTGFPVLVTLPTTTNFSVMKQGLDFHLNAYKNSLKLLPSVFTLKHNSKVNETSWQGKTDKLTEKNNGKFTFHFICTVTAHFWDHNLQIQICTFPFQHAWVTSRDINYIYRGEKKSLSGCPAQADSKGWEK